jgi:methyl-accepting chemotaxis protein
MKKYIFLAVLIGLIGCQQQKNEIARLSNVQDSLSYITAEKDSAILDFLMAFNEIQENLDSIKRLEKIVSLASGQQGELKGTKKQQILEDITTLNQLIQKNKELNASLQQRLTSANSRIGQLQGVVTEFERMVNSLNAQVEQKNTEITQLNRDVERLNIDVTQLASEVINVRQEVQEKTQIIEQQTEVINKVFYAMGSIKELTENNVLEKSGGVLGIGRTLKMRKDFNRDYFTTADLRGLTYLPLHSKKARVVSVHPLGSYRITGTKTADTLYIDDSQEFWKASRYLLLVVD